MRRNNNNACAVNLSWFKFIDDMFFFYFQHLLWITRNVKSAFSVAFVPLNSWGEIFTPFAATFYNIVQQLVAEFALCFYFMALLQTTVLMSVTRLNPNRDAEGQFDPFVHCEFKSNIFLVINGIM